MRNHFLNYTAVGIFVAAMIAALVVALSLLSGRTGPTDTYFVVLDDVTDVKYGTVVRFAGYPIGQVEEISPEIQRRQIPLPPAARRTGRLEIPAGFHRAHRRVQFPCRQDRGSQRRARQRHHRAGRRDRGRHGRRHVLVDGAGCRRNRRSLQILAEAAGGQNRRDHRPHRQHHRDQSQGADGLSELDRP